MTDSKDGKETVPEVQKVVEAYQAYQTGGYEGLLQLARKRNEEARQEALEQDQRLTDALNEA